MQIVSYFYFKANMTKESIFSRNCSKYFVKEMITERETTHGKVMHTGYKFTDPVLVKTKSFSDAWTTDVDDLSSLIAQTVSVSSDGGFKMLCIWEIVMLG